MSEVMLEKNERTIEGVVRMSFDGKYPSISGLAVAYNRISDAPLPESPLIKEKIAVGAFKRSVEEDDIKLLWEHERKYVLGRTRAKTLTLKENDEGVSFENVPPDIGWARDLQTSIKRGDISSMSFRFSGSAHYERMAGGAYLQVIDEGRLDEISIVTSPVYLSTSVYSRSAEGILLVNNTPVDVIIDPDVKNFNPQTVDINELWKRYDIAVAKNLGGK
jgi:hypothetical protein